MGLGVLEIRSTDHVPGTIRLRRNVHDASNGGALDSLKLKDHKKDDIVKVPQPSADPNDPLNWSSRKKHLIAAIVFFGSVIDTAIPAPLLTSGTLQIAHDLKISVNDLVTISTGYYLLASGAACPIVVACSRKYGKRPVFVMSSLLAVAGCIVGGLATTSSALLAARVLQGIAQTAYETLVFACIGDLLFVHERGPRVAVGVSLLNAIANLVGIIAGTITLNLGWRYNFYILVPFAALQAIMTILFVPETAYNRDRVLGQDSVYCTSNASPEISGRGIASDPIHTTDKGGEVDGNSMLQLPIESPNPYTWRQELRIYTGQYVEDPIWKIIVSFPVVLLNLGSVFAVFSCGLTLTWLAATLTISSVLLAEPPYNYTSNVIGYISAAPAIGAMLAGLFMGGRSDRCLKLLTRLNNGIYEPEFQLPLTMAGIVSIMSGLIGLGYAYDRGSSVYAICVCWCIATFGFSTCNTAYFNYALSAFQEYSSEILVMSACFRNFLGYGMTVFIIPWLDRDGPKDVFTTLAETMAAPAILVIIFYVFGKRYRFFWHRHNVLKKWNLEAEKMSFSES